MGDDIVIIRTAVQHGDRLVRTGLAHVLGMEPDIAIVGYAERADELVALTSETRPDVVLLELDAVDWDGPSLAAALQEVQPALRVVGLHHRLPPDVARRAYQAGVHCTIAASAGTDAIVAALRDGQVVTPMTDPAPSRHHRSALSFREVDILRGIAAGRLTREIADDLGITPKAVENHKQCLFRKLDVQNQAHAVSIAIRRGDLAPAMLSARV